MIYFFFRIKTEVDWINSIAKTPILGGLFTFLIMFIPAVLLSFVFQLIIPYFNNDTGFTKLMLILLPGWNLSLWLLKVRLYLFSLPSWILLGGISLIKGILMIAGISDGQ